MKSVNNKECLIFLSRSESENELTISYAKNEFNVSYYKTISDYKISDYYIDLKKYTISDLSISDWKLIDRSLNLDEVILKDRLLRNIKLTDAKRLIYSVAKYSIELFKENKFELLVVHPVDNYVMDVLIRIAKEFNCEVSGISAFFVQGYKRVTVYGEHNTVREVSENEINTVKKILTHRFKSYMTPSQNKAIKNSLLYYFKYKMKYLLFYILFYKILNKEEYDYVATPYSATVDKVNKFFPFKYFTNDLNISDKEKSIYIPLHYHPEATIEYWSDSLTNVDYVFSLLKAVKYFSEKGWTVYLKEHPAMCFRQEIDLYKDIKRIKNVYILNPFLETSDVMNQFDNYLIWTGSTGIEALLNSKTVYFASSNYYYTKTSNDEYEKFFLKSEKEKDQFLKNILSNTIIWK